MAGLGSLNIPAGLRQSAAAVALGAPKGVTKAAPAKLPKVAVKAPAKLPAGKAPAKAPAKAPSYPKVPKAPSYPEVPNYGNGLHSEPEKLALQKSYEQRLAEAELTPLREEQASITANEQGASQRYGAQQTGVNELLTNLAKAQEGSAKTFENQAAENALQQGKAIETTGQQQATATGGYVAPELKAELNAEAQREAGAGAAGNTFAQNSAQAGGNLLAGIRASAALRATEGQSKIAGTFGKQSQKVTEAENRVIPKVALAGANYSQKNAEAEAKNAETVRGLGLKTIETQNKTAATKSKIQDERSKEQDERSKEEVARAKVGPEIQKDEADAAQAAAKAKNELHKIATGTGGLTSSEQDKLVEQLGAAYSTIGNLRSKGVPEARIGEHLATGYRRVETEPGSKKYVNEKISKVENTTLQKAAFELWKYHTVSAVTQAGLRTLGISLTPQQLATLVGL
jgi:hypothetical protein